MYFTLEPRRIAVVASVVLVMVIGVAGTFSYKQTHYGDVNLTYALENVFKQQRLYFLYALRDSGRNLTASVSSVFGTETEAQSKDANAIPVLLYHGLNDSGGYSVPAGVFAEQMEALYEAGWQTITLDQFEGFINRGEPLPERSFLLTFDDGAKDSYYPADPVLKVLDYHAVSFILPKYSIGGGTHYYLSSGEIRTMLDSGRWEIGSHGNDSHEFVTIAEDGELGAKLANRAWLPSQNRLETVVEFKDRVTADLSSSKQNLEKEFDRDIWAFAFPFGEFGQLSQDHELAVSNDIDKIARLNYRLAFYQTWGGEGYSFNYPSHQDQAFMIKRIEPKPDTSPEALVQKLESGLPKNLPYSDTFTEDHGWFSIWGHANLQDESLVLKASDNQTGAAAVLDGSGHWENYRARFNLKSESGSGFVIFARYQDNQNYAGCNFGNDFMHAEETLDDKRSVIKGIRDASIIIPTGQDFNVEVEVTDRTLVCRMGDTVVSTTFLDQSLNHGGVGVKVWNEIADSADLTVLDVNIEPLN